jgi:hypothetical protein
LAKCSVTILVVDQRPQDSCAASPLTPSREGGSNCLESWKSRSIGFVMACMFFNLAVISQVT